jgi:hypothetical protein
VCLLHGDDNNDRYACVHVCVMTEEALHSHTHTQRHACFTCSWTYRSHHKVQVIAARDVLHSQRDDVHNACQGCASTAAKTLHRITQRKQRRSTTTTTTEGRIKENKDSGCTTDTYPLSLASLSSIVTTPPRSGRVHFFRQTCCRAAARSPTRPFLCWKVHIPPQHDHQKSAAPASQQHQQQ